ncbi:hypothetical protein CONPUDRAFT_51115, partial [Coniophora puteana RWD-64-598 SS2]
WAAGSHHLFCLVNLILALTHPQQYAAAREVLGLCKNFHTTPCARLWDSVFTGVGVIANRVTEPHKDTGGYLPWYDILFTAGDYDGGVFNLSALGLQFAYPPGCVIAVCGKLLRHSVPIVDGNRVCSAFYMKQGVQVWAGTCQPEWSRGPKTA